MFNVSSTDFSNSNIPSQGEPLEGEPANSNHRVDTIRQKICSWDQCKRENANMLCGRCELVRYCNATCQKNDWAFHRTFCKKPTPTNVLVTAFNPATHIQTAKSIPLNLHLQEDVEQPLTKPTGISDLKQKNMSGLQGNMINITIEDDLASYSQRYRDNKTIPELKRLGYKGLRQTDEKKLEDLLGEQKYVEILKHVWTEDDVDFKIEWLRRNASKGHVILMFETYRAMCHLTKHTEKTILEAHKWRILGGIHTDIDGACHKDKGLHDVGEYFKQCYSFDHLFPKKIMKQCRKKIDRLEKVILEVKLLDSDPSPKWLIYHGMNAFMGISTLVPQEEWLTLRMQKLEQMKSAIKK